MKTKFAAIMFTLAFCPLMAEPSDTRETPASGENSPESLKQSLLDSLEADLARIDEADHRQRHSLNLLIQGVKNFDPETASQYALTQLAGYAKSPTITADSQRKYANFETAMLSALADAAGRQQANFNKRCKDFILRAAAATDPAEIGAIQVELTAYGNELSSLPARPRDIPGNHLNGIENLLQSLMRLTIAGEAEDWENMGRNLQQFEQHFAKVRPFLSAEEAEDLLKKIRGSAGALPLDELKREFDTTLNALLDDANQDQLEEWNDRIQKFRAIYGSSSSPEYTHMANRWRSLASLAETFARAVRNVKESLPPSFQPEQWAQSNSGSRQIIKTEELIRHLKNYKVRVNGEKGADSIVRMYYDEREIMARIASLADVGGQLPDLRRSLAYTNYGGDPGTLAAVLPILQYYADVHDQLKSGDEFVMPVNPVRQREQYTLIPRADNRYSDLLARLDEELVWQLLRRFLSDLPPDAKGSPWPHVKERMQTAAERRDFQSVLLIHQFAQLFGAQQLLLPPTEWNAIQHYLAGRHQEDQMEQPRLATLHYQKAAGSRSNMVCMDDLKQRLHRLRSEHRAEYDKGTDDSLSATAGDLFSSHVTWKVSASK